jgi:BirA family biotin operon repressor/biotin-[acetyl-CoA-carboxylase] ligase
VLIKENHVRAAGGVTAAVTRARLQAPHTLRVECEVTTLDELREALAAGAGAVLLDNMDDATVREAVAIVGKAGHGRGQRRGRAGEASRRSRSSGIDVISVGKLTHSAPASDISLLFELRTRRVVAADLALGQVREHHDCLGSTNDRALAWARAGAPHGAMVTADAQTHGRGRLGRAGSRRRARGCTRAWCCGRRGVVGVGGARVGGRAGGARGAGAVVAGATLKWPNDVLVRRAQAGGVLCETRWQGSVAELVRGSGSTCCSGSFRRSCGRPASRSSWPDGTCPSRQEVLEAVLEGLEGVLAGFFAGGFAAIRGGYERAQRGARAAGDGRRGGGGGGRVR